MRNLRLRLLFYPIFAIAASAFLNAQLPLAPQDEKVASVLLDRQIPADELLHCKIARGAPFLDFAFRFYAGHLISFPLRELLGNETTLVSLVRITPENGKPVVMGEAYQSPARPERLRAEDVEKLKLEVEISGGFVAGEGNYLVEAMLIDKEGGRSCRAQWKTKILRNRSERSVPVSIEENTVAPLIPFSWKRSPEYSGSGPRVTVLLDAAPVLAYSPKLRAWDRAFLLSTLTTTLEQIKADSVRVIAFNLDQQKEIFHDNEFDSPGFEKLATTLRGLELGTVSYRTLQTEPVDLLVSMAKAEVSTDDPSDAVIFLGPQTRFFQKVKRELLQPVTKSAPKFFYIGYVPPFHPRFSGAMMRAEFPDMIEQLTKSLNGAAFRIHSPAELEKAIEKISEQLPHSEDAPQP